MKHFYYNIEEESTPVSEGITRKVLSHTEKLIVVELSCEEGAITPLHSHVHEQQTYIIEGEFRFTIGDEERIVGPGDCLAEEPNILHGGVCLKKGKIVDVFTPERQDFLTKK
jgi:quercetin dioxygenase-like cupin family protein